MDRSGATAEIAGRGTSTGIIGFEIGSAESVRTFSNVISKPPNGEHDRHKTRYGFLLHPAKQQQNERITCAFFWSRDGVDY